MKLVRGVGFNDRKYISHIRRIPVTEYNLWSSMLNRCYTVSENDKAYIGCSVSEEFKSYSYFYEWCQNQIGFKSGNFHLDKDIIKKGNRVYSPDTCAFVPFDINMLFNSRKSLRGEFPIGVAHMPKFNEYRARIKMYGRSVHLGYFPTVESAFNAYKVAKEAYVKEIANKFRNDIDPRVYESMMVFSVEITD